MKSIYFLQNQLHLTSKRESRYINFFYVVPQSPVLCFLFPDFESIKQFLLTANDQSQEAA